MTPLIRNATRYTGKLSNKLRRKLDQLSEGEELTGTQGRVLCFIMAAKDPLYQKDIEEEYSIRPSSATELLNQLERKGYIIRKESKRDKRLKEIIPTEKAIRNHSEVLEKILQMDREMTAGISKKDLETFLKVIEIMLKNLD